MCRCLTACDDIQNWGSCSFQAFFSILSGPLLSCASASLFCLIPAHNILEQPKFWYEFQILAFIGLVPLFLSQILVQVNYWGDFSFENKWISNLSLSVLGAIVFALSIIGHYYLWTLVLGYTPPMAFNQYLAGSMSFSAMCIALWFWWVHLSRQKILDTVTHFST